MMCLSVRSNASFGPLLAAAITLCACTNESSETDIDDSTSDVPASASNGSNSDSGPEPGTTEGTTDDSGETTSDESGTAGSETEDTPAGCQVEMSGRDAQRFVAGRSDRMPTLAELIGGPSSIGEARPSAPVDDWTTPALHASSDDVGFIADPDGGTTIECDIWAQDCADGEKCMPWANDGGGSWNATKCTAVDASPNAPGDPCTAEGSGVSGVDDCELGAMCWSVEPDTNEGVCVALCTGDETAPTCEDPKTICSVTNDGVLPLCLPICNPLADECTQGEGCYPSSDVFTCVPTTGGAVGEPCEFSNACSNGSFCAAAETVPGCTGSGCCTQFCEIGNDSVCAEGQTCVPWYEMGEAPDECLAEVGACSAAG